MGKPAVELPNLANATPTFLVDEIGKVKEQISRLETLEEFYKAALKSRITPEQTTLEGDDFVMAKTSFKQVRLNQQRAAEKLAQMGMLQECQDTLDVTQMRFKRREKD